MSAQESWPKGRGPAIREGDLLPLCTEWYEQWQDRATDQQSVFEVTDRLVAYVNRGSSHAEEVMRCVAQLVYQACTATGRYSQQSPPERNLSYLNPLVLVFAGGGDDAYDPELDFNAPYWAMYAGRCDSLNARGIVASLVHESHFAGLVQLLRDVRHYLYFPELDNAAIFTKRRELGTAIASVIEEATYQVLDKLAASRIVVFSDIPLDYLPYHGSMLGLEVPISRYPILLAYFIVNEGFRRAARSMVNAEGTLCSVLCANEAHDPATAWACETGKRVGNMFSSYFGRNVLCGPPLAKSARCHHISIRGQDRGNLRFRPYTPLGFLPAMVSSLSGKSGIGVSRSLGFEEGAL